MKHAILFAAFVLLGTPAAAGQAEGESLHLAREWAINVASAALRGSGRVLSVSTFLRIVARLVPQWFHRRPSSSGRSRDASFRVSEPLSSPASTAEDGEARPREEEKGGPLLLLGGLPEQGSPQSGRPVVARPGAVAGASVDRARPVAEPFTAVSHQIPPGPKYFFKRVAVS